MKSIYVQLLGTTLLLIIGSGSRAHAQQLTESNVAQFEVTEPGFIIDGPSIFNATFSAGENQLVVEPFNFGGKSRFWVHGLQPGDQVTVGAPGHEQKTVVYRGEPFIDMWLYRTSAYTPPPPTIAWNLAYESPAPPSAAVMNDKVFYVYSLYWPQYPLVVSSMGGEAMQLAESSTTGAALAAWNGNLFLAWQGVNNDLLNVMSSSDEGRTWHGKVTLPVKTNTKPALAVINGQLALAWTQGFDNQINVMFSPDGRNWTDQQALPLSSAIGPALASFAGKLVLAYVNTGPRFFYPQNGIGLASWDGVQWDFAPFLADTTLQSPALSVVGGKLMLTWTGVGNKNINTYEVDATLSVENKHTYDLTSSKTPLLLDYRTPQSSPSIGLALLLYNFNGDAGGSERFFDDGSFTPPNNDFENGLVGWSTFSTHPDFAPFVSSHAASGTWSLAEDQNGIVFTDIGGLQPGRKYTVSAYVDSSPSASAAAILWAHDTEGGNVVVAPNVHPQGWRKVTVDFVADSTGKIRIHLARTDGSGSIFWDTVSVTAD